MKSYYPLLALVLLTACSKKNEDPAPSTQPTVDALQSSQWKCNGVSRRTVRADGSTNSSYAAGSIEVRFSPTGTWYLGRAADANGPGVNRSGSYTYTGSTLTLSIAPPTTFKVVELTNDKLTITEVFPVATDGSRIEDEYQSTRKP